MAAAGEGGCPKAGRCWIWEVWRAVPVSTTALATLPRCATMRAHLPPNGWPRLTVSLVEERAAAAAAAAAVAVS